MSKTYTMLKIVKLSLATLLVILVVTASAGAAHYWQVAINTPYAASGGYTNKTSTTVEYKVLSTSNDGGDQYDINVTRNGSIVSSKTIAPGGDAERTTVNLPSDGSYDFQIVATSLLDGNDKSSKTVTVIRDTLAPAAPAYGSSNQSGTSFTVTYTPPVDASEVIVYSSTSSEFTANSQTEVGRVPITNSQQQTFTYNSGSTAERFHAVQAVDRAGNSSPLVGDSETVIRNQVVVVPAADTNSSAVTTASATTNSASNGDQVDVLGVQNTIEEDQSGNSENQAVDILGVGDEKQDNDESGSNLIDALTSPIIIASILVSLAILYVLAKRDVFDRNNQKT